MNMDQVEKLIHMEAEDKERKKVSSIEQKKFSDFKKPIKIQTLTSLKEERR